MAIVWDPRATLDIYPDEFGFTCVGTTQKGFRCRNSFIRNQYLLQAGEILNTLSQNFLVQLLADAPRLLAALRKLSWLTLCPRWHQKPGRHDQTLLVASNWLRILQSTECLPRQVLPSGIPAVPSLLLSPTTLSPSTVLSRQCLASQTTPSLASSRLPLSPPASTTSTRTSRIPPSYARGPMLVRTLDPAESIRQNPTAQVNTGIILSGPIRAAGDLNLNITLNSEAGSNITYPRRDIYARHTALATSCQAGTPPSSPPDSASRRSVSATSSNPTPVSNQPITHHDIQALLTRINNLETQLQQATSRRSSRSSRSSGASSSTGMFTPTSSVMSLASEVSIPARVDRSVFFATPPQSPTPLPRPRILSISTDTSTSPSIMTPTSSTCSSPTAPPSPLSLSLAHPRTSAWLSDGPRPRHTHLSSRPTSKTSTSSSSSSPTLRTSPISLGPSLPSATHRQAGSISDEPLAPGHASHTTACHMCRLPTPTITAAQCLGANGCRNQCCTLCLTEWISSQLDDDKTPSCPFCHVTWVF